MDGQLVAVNLSSLPTKCDEHLLLPQITGHAIKAEMDTQALSEAHHAFYLADDRNSSSTAMSKAAKDIAVIRHAFPAVEDDQTLFAMATWFALLCKFDDEIELLSSEAARTALEESIILLQASVLGTNGAEATISLVSFSSNSERAVALTEAFISQLRGSLPRRLYAKLITIVIACWEAMILETALRTNPDDVDENAYLSIRSETVGLKPFFLLLSHATGASRCYRSSSELQRQISLVVGLQNDMLGLSKDITSSECSNFVILESKRPGQNMSLALEKTVRMHNDAVGALLDCRQKECESSEQCTAVTKYLDSMLGFIAQHFAWASRAERYAIIQCRPA